MTFAFVITPRKGKFMTDKEIFAPYHPGEMLRVSVRDNFESSTET